MSGSTLPLRPLSSHDVAVSPSPSVPLGGLKPVMEGEAICLESFLITHTLLGLLFYRQHQCLQSGQPRAILTGKELKQTVGPQIQREESDCYINALNRRISRRSRMTGGDVTMLTPVLSAALNLCMPFVSSRAKAEGSQPGALRTTVRVSRIGNYMTERPLIRLHHSMCVCPRHITTSSC